MLALIDGDIVLHRVGYTTDNDPEWVAKARVDEMLDGILLDTSATEFQIFLSDSKENNFRYKVWPGYKANRKQPRPVHYDFIKEHLITNWATRIAYGMEADDALGINQDNGRPTFDIPPEVWDTVICSIDKDLKQIPGNHYNFVTKAWTIVEPTPAEEFFYAQLLIGDTTDNIRGCRGIGAVKAGKALAGLKTNAERFQRAYDIYREKEKEMSPEEILEHLLLIGRLLKIKQSEDEPLWDFPLSGQLKDIWQSYTQRKEGEAIQSTEPTVSAEVTGARSLGPPMAIGLQQTSPTI